MRLVTRLQHPRPTLLRARFEYATRLPRARSPFFRKFPRARRVRASRMTVVLFIRISPSWLGCGSVMKETQHGPLAKGGAGGRAAGAEPQFGGTTSGV